MELTSTAFEHNGTIPPAYTCDGEDRIVPLRISDVPPGTKSLALIVDDPDAPGGTWDHWIVFNMPPETAEIASEPDAPHGTNSWKRLAWGGPCPPDKEHRYFFKLYALDTMLDLSQGAAKADLEQSMQGHVLAQATLIGSYTRQK